MKKVIFLCFILTLSYFTGIAQSQKKANADQSTNKVEAFYFHNATRCVTCKAVEAEAKADLESLYGTQVTFQSLNLEDDATNPIAEKLKVSGQTLLLVKGDQQVNITNEGFMYARTNPAKFKKIIKEKVDKLLNL